MEGAVVSCRGWLQTHGELTADIAGFDVARTGVASVGFIGFPSVGKSTLMSKLTGQHSEGKSLTVLDEETILTRHSCCI